MQPLTGPKYRRVSNHTLRGSPFFGLIVLGSIAAAAQEADRTRVSPFTRVQLISGAARVEYQGHTYDLVSVEGIKTEQILTFCRQTYADRWEKRFAEDLVEVLAGMGKKVGDAVSLVLRDPATGDLKTVERAPMTAGNREAIRRSRNPRPRQRSQPSLRPLTPAQMHDALNAFQQMIEQRWSYLLPSRFDHRQMLSTIRSRIGAGLSPDDFVLELQKVIGRGIDGHAGISNWERFAPPGYLPFLVEPLGDRNVAFKPDRSGFLSDAYPYIESIDGRPIAAWIQAASLFVPDGSPQLVRRQGLRCLRLIQFLRREMGISRERDLVIELSSADGRDRTTITLGVTDRAPSYGTWPRESARPETPQGVTYLRLSEMDTSDAPARVNAAIASAANARGLIIDVRDNGGGSRHALRTLAAHLIGPDDRPRVVNVAAYRLHPDHGASHMASRFLYPEGWAGWSTAEREAIANVRRRFQPEWSPLPDAYSEWHYMVLSPPQDQRRQFARPVAILMDSKCFSATDVFLGALKGVPNVTLVGTPSSGGSANATITALAGTDLEVRLGTMVSFREDGRFFDAHGIEPDVHVGLTPEFYIGGRDAQLEAAIRVITSVPHQRKEDSQ